MAQKAAIVIFLGLIFALNSVDCSSEPNIQVDVVHNLNEFLRANPTATLLEPVKNGTSPRLTLTYKTGQRVNGDSLQAQLIDWFTYAAPQDVKATFNYPVSGTGAIVSYIQVDIEQSTNEGKAYITDGGIGQRKIVLIVEGSNTLYFRYKTYIYGY